MELRHIIASFLAYLLLLSKVALAQETSDSSTSTTTTTTGTTSTSLETAIVTNRFLVPAGYQGGRRTKDPELDPDVRWVIGSIVPIKWDFNVPGRVTIQVYQMAWDGMIWFEDIAREVENTGTYNWTVKHVIDDRELNIHLFEVGNSQHGIDSKHFRIYENPAQLRCPTGTESGPTSSTGTAESPSSDTSIRVAMLRVGLGVGLGIGLPFLLAVGCVLYLVGRKPTSIVVINENPKQPWGGSGDLGGTEDHWRVEHSPSH